MEKKIAILLGIIAFVVIAMIITRGKIWTLLILGAIAYAIYKNNRY